MHLEVTSPEPEVQDKGKIQVHTRYVKYTSHNSM